MPYKYVLKWSKGEKEKITVEAWNRYSTDKPEKPLFTIGQISGSRALLLRERSYAPFSFCLVWCREQLKEIFSN